MPCLHRLLPLAALATMLLAAGSAAAGRPLSPQPENLGPAAEVGRGMLVRQGAGQYLPGRRGRWTQRLCSAACRRGCLPRLYSPLPPVCLQGNVTAQDGAHPFLERAGGAAAAAGAAAATAAREGAAASAGAAAAAAALPTPSWLPAGTFSGDGTAYSEAVAGTGAGFACSYRYLNPYFSTHFAAINKPMVRGSRAAGAEMLGRGACSARVVHCRPLPPAPPAVGRGRRLRALHHGLVRGRPLPGPGQEGDGHGHRPVPRVQGG